MDQVVDFVLTALLMLELLFKLILMLVWLQIEKHAEVDVGVIADPVVDADAIPQFMTKMAHVVSTD